MTCYEPDAVTAGGSAKLCTAPNSTIPSTNQNTIRRMTMLVPESLPATHRLKTFVTVDRAKSMSNARLLFWYHHSNNQNRLHHADPLSLGRRHIGALLNKAEFY